MGSYATQTRLHAYVRSLVPRSVGLQQQQQPLVDAPLPKNYIDENNMKGKAVNRDKPDSAQGNVQLQWKQSDGTFLVLANHLLSVDINIVQSLLTTSLGITGSICSKTRVKCLKL